MLIRIKRGWELPESQATPEDVFLKRRSLLKAAAAGPLLLGAGGLLAGCDDAPNQVAEAADDPKPVEDPSAGLYPVDRNERYVLDRPITDETLATTYNNYYEFGSSKNIWQKAQALPIRPWTVAIDGMVETPMQIGIDDLLAKMPLEERLYRHRCVEAWSMAVPYSGFPMKALVDLARPLSSARYVRMETFLDRDTASGQNAAWYPWPYIEGLTMAEATHELAFIATGLYGKPIPKQNGAPLRLAVPWKYGFKHIKGIVRFEFTDQRPVSFWEEIQGGEYGFWANVNPEVPHPRWSQATERVLGVDERVPTLLYNGYGEFVADLYKDMDPKAERLFM
ncbi:protein-methionine-sulfoxide reductase catalytic subunit MsrP [Pelagibius sp.]|uniref:protein-methionine-sulfoxide reductase catalytic subunit MsrP n=1 Tax=Pelagibius sp. TaxID=1931238 RepID=UPI002615C7AF|nr:protein-methionine-sulfoxide reductase catalytic subunit MsrP [Pelagibius sp.]